MKKTLEQKTLDLISSQVIGMFDEKPIIRSISELQSAIVDLAISARLEGQENLTEALEIIAGKRQCIDNLMSNQDVALQALRQIEETEGR